MARENYLYGEERPLPFWVQLTKITDNPTGPLLNMLPTLMLIDFRGGEFTRPTSARLAEVFEWLIRSLNVRRDQVTDYALMITPLPREEDEKITGGTTPYIRDDWPTLRERSFLWLPISYDEREKRYAWQR